MAPPATSIARAEHLELVADGLALPTSVTFAPDGTTFVAESGLPFGGAAAGGRVWRLEPDGGRTLLAKDLAQPLNGLAFHDGALFVSQGGNSTISRLDLDGTLTPVVTGLPAPGNYHTNMVAFSPDGWMYFSQGALTNTGVVGLDALTLGWLRKLPHPYDVPGHDITLTGLRFSTRDPLSDDPDATAVTGPFAPWGSTHPVGHRIPGSTRATAAVLRCRPDGSELALVAWGLRNAYGLGFLPDGRLLATDQGADDRGSRPVGNVPDLLFDVQPGRWYGWPDYVGRTPVTDPRFDPEGGAAREFVIADHDALPPLADPLLEFPTHTSAVKFDVVPSGPLVGQLVVALFGDEVPMTAPSGPPVGRNLVRVDPSDWSMHPFLEGTLSRPLDVRFGPDGDLYLLDFGHFEMRPAGGLEADPAGGRLWKLPALAVV